MHLLTGNPRRFRLLLALALSAGVMQVLGCTLPPLVVCHRADRPPRLEIFSGSCSCRQAEVASCSAQSEHSAPCLEDDCIDIDLKLFVLPAVSASRQDSAAKSPVRTFGPERRTPPSSFFSLQLEHGSPTGSKSPLPLSLACANLLLRC